MKLEECVIFKKPKDVVYPLQVCVEFIRTPFIPVDLWRPQNENEVFLKEVKGAIYFPISKYYGIEDNNVNYFVLAPKKCYNSDQIREHVCRYINYFEVFYDKDHEYLSLLAQVKMRIDTIPEYDINAFMYDLYRYFINANSGLFAKSRKMVDDNYYIELKYKHPRNPALEYNSEHGRILMHYCIIYNMILTLITHFCYKKKIPDCDSVLMNAYDMVMRLYTNVDMYSKLYETANTNIEDKARNDAELWMKQDIRGINTTTHTDTALHNIILNIMPKYTFDGSVVSLNFAAIKYTITYSIDIEYEFSYVKLSSSKRDGEDASSEYDKYESYLIKQNEALYVQNVAIAMDTMDNVSNIFGPFSIEEVNYYFQKLGGYEAATNPFQKMMIKNLFAKYFGDTVSGDAVSRYDYVRLMIAAKRMLKSDCKMIILPYVFSSKVEKYICRKSISKKDLAILDSIELWPLVLEKYDYNEDIIDFIYTILATILSSDFRIIDFEDKEIDGKKLEIIVPHLFVEVCMFALMV